MGQLKVILIFVIMIVTAIALFIGAIALFDYGFDAIPDPIRDWLPLIPYLVGVAWFLHIRKSNGYWRALIRHTAIRDK